MFRYVSIQLVPISLWLTLGLGLLTTACITEDTGKLCTAAVPNVVSDPIAGEEPVVQIISLSRDQTCETFQCLNHFGLDPYCTRTCKYPPRPKDAKACVTSSDCTTPLHCYEGYCQDDDCPKGFECGKIQETGPLENTLYCKRIERCTSDPSCEALATIACVEHVCFDECPQINQSCLFHRQRCVPKKDAACRCANNEETCADQELLCQPNIPNQTWPNNSFQQIKYCVPKE